jgi:hypothetical protein
VDATNRSDSFPSKQTMDYSNWTSALTRGSEATSKGAPLASNQLPAVAWLAEEGTSDSVGFDSMQFDFGSRTGRLAGTVRFPALVPTATLRFSLKSKSTPYSSFWNNFLNGRETATRPRRSDLAPLS